MSINPKRWSFLMLNCMALALSSCIAVGTSPTSLSQRQSPTSTLSVVDKMATVTVTPTRILHSGSVQLEASFPPESGYSSTDILKASFDFDATETGASDLESNDLTFGLTAPHPDPYLVLGPSSGAKAKLLKAGQPASSPDVEEYSFETCSDVIDEAGVGGVPIPSIGSYYCWLTNEGRLAEFRVEKIELISETEGSYRIEIKYVVWDKVLSH